jgi:hypothetical protein
MSVSIALICEGNTDPPTVCALADRFILAGIDWIAKEDIDTHRHFRGFDAGARYMAWTQIDELADQHGVKLLGHFEGFPIHKDGRNLRRALALLTLHTSDDPPVEAIIIFRDGDKEYDDRREAIHKVRDASQKTIPVMIGVANRMRECWVINGFEPANEDENGRLATEHARVGFDPRFRAHELTATNIGEDRCAKRVLRELTGDELDRELACVRDTSEETLRTRGKETGLREFIDELKNGLAAAFR